jgi:hypothetical protein
MDFLTREQILQANDIVTEEVSVPEWGGKVLVRGLTGTERDALEASLVDMKSRKSQSFNLQNMRAKLVVMAVVGPGGGRVFTDEDVKALGKKSASALNRVFEKAQQLAGLTEEDVEELTKNSESDQS